jgi:hypothetical protein
MRGIAIGWLALALASGTAGAQTAQSAYSDLDLAKGCVFDPPVEGGDGHSGCAWCAGIGKVRVRFCEGDLRQSIEYGPVDDKGRHWASFGQFNHMSPRIEWRLAGGRPFAAIQRRFIENDDPATGSPSKASEGQVLVVTKVATAADPVSCFIAFVDARANANANELARQAADSLGPGFRCGQDEARFHGARGPFAGDPQESFE